MHVKHRPLGSESCHASGPLVADIDFDARISRLHHHLFCEQRGRVRKCGHSEESGKEENSLKRMLSRLPPELQFFIELMSIVYFARQLHSTGTGPRQLLAEGGPAQRPPLLRWVNRVDSATSAICPVSG